MGCPGCCGCDKRKVFVDENCIGCGACTAVCNDIFELNEEGKAFVIEGQEFSCADEAINVCPVNAINYK